MKRSSRKATLPGRHQVFRSASGDVIGLVDEPLDGRPLLEPVLRAGRRVCDPPSLDAIRTRAAAELALLPEAVRALRDPAGAAHEPLAVDALQPSLLVTDPSTTALIVRTQNDFAPAAPLGSTAHQLGAVIAAAAGAGIIATRDITRQPSRSASGRPLAAALRGWNARCRAAPVGGRLSSDIVHDKGRDPARAVPDFDDLTSPTASASAWRHPRGGGRPATDHRVRHRAGRDRGRFETTVPATRSPR
jgi:hypothetical protein